MLKFHRQISFLQKPLQASLLTSLTFNVVADIIKIHPTSVYNQNNQQYRVTVVFAMITRRNFLTTKRLPFYSLFISSNNKKILQTHWRKFRLSKARREKVKVLSGRRVFGCKLIKTIRLGNDDRKKSFKGKEESFIPDGTLQGYWWQRIMCGWVVINLKRFNGLKIFETWLSVWVI